MPVRQLTVLAVLDVRARLACRAPGAESARRLELRPYGHSLGEARTVEREERGGHAVSEDRLRSVFAQGGAELEAVAGAAAEEPEVGGFRMTVEEKVAVRGVLVLADPGFHQRRPGKGREAAGHGGAGCGEERRRQRPLGEGGIEGVAPRVVRHLEATVLVAGNAVIDALPAEVDPHRTGTVFEAQIARRGAEVENFLPSRKNPALADHLGKEAA